MKSEQKKLQAFLNDPSLKIELLYEVERHRLADQIAHCGYSNGGKGELFRGCAVGCSIDSLNRIKGLVLDHSSHSDLAEQLGITLTLARLQDGIFEGLPLAESLTWPGRFYEAIPVGSDTSMVWPQFAHWLLVDAVHGVIKFATREGTKAEIQAVADLYARWIAGDKPTREEWVKSRSAAAAAAAYAAYAAYAAAADAADAAAAYAAYAAAAAAAYAAAAAAAYAAYAAAAAAADAAGYKTRIAQSEKLIELLTDCK